MFLKNHNLSKYLCNTFNVLIASGSLRIGLMIVTESPLISLNQPIGQFTLVVAMSVCMCVCMSHPGNDASQWTRGLWSKDVSLIVIYLYSSIKKESFVAMTFCVFQIFGVFAAGLPWTSLLQTSLLWTMR